tara:strand:+ start:734 stop:1114 length:381 start_codon:yes stop_codon:yes gene_type:complete
MAARVYQIMLTKTQRDAINKLGWDQVDAGKAKMNVMNEGFKGWLPHYQQYYKLAYELKSDDLDEIFKLTNVWNDPERVEKCNDRATSTSVGDIIELDGTKMWMVDPLGFTRMHVFEDEISEDRMVS